MSDVIDEAYRDLAIAILQRAARDARRRDNEAACARRWLVVDPWADDLLSALGLNPECARAWVGRLPELRQRVWEL
ncbi:MAG: hypothetical protein SXV54_26660 [Chloroflexota bacterium]|nr:hypothetical protein [Chloroflexota bacterium]